MRALNTKNVIVVSIATVISLGLIIWGLHGCNNLAKVTCPDGTKIQITISSGGDESNSDFSDIKDDYCTTD